MSPAEASGHVRLSVRQRIEQHCNHAEVAVGRKHLHPLSSLVAFFKKLVSEEPSVQKRHSGALCLGQATLGFH